MRERCNYTITCMLIVEFESLMLFSVIKYFELNKCTVPVKEFQSQNISLFKVFPVKYYL